MKTIFWRGRLHFAVPVRRCSPWSGVMRRLEQARAFKVTVAVAAPPRRRVPIWRLAAVHAAPTSAPRPREQRSAAPHGRAGDGRDDGGGDDGDGGGGGSEPPPRSGARHVLEDGGRRP